MVGLGLYCTVGTLWDPTLTRYNMGIAMRALVAVWPALALSFGRVVIPIHGVDDPRYGFTSKGIYSPGLSLVPGLCADYSAAQFEDGLLPFNSSARYGHFTSDFGPPSPPIRRDEASFASSPRVVGANGVSRCPGSMKGVQHLEGGKSKHLLCLLLA